MPTTDAGVEPSTAPVVAAVDAAVDAPRVKKPDRRDRRDRIRNAPKRDAGVAHEPEIDFLPSKR